jgi:hypothetical protein
MIKTRFTANRGDDDEAWRLVRVMRVYVNVLAKIEADEQAKEKSSHDRLHACMSAVAQVHDHKGSLTVLFTTARDALEWWRYFEDAWGDENECILHIGAVANRQVVYSTEDADEYEVFHCLV